MFPPSKPFTVCFNELWVKDRRTNSPKTKFRKYLIPSGTLCLKKSFFFFPLSSVVAYCEFTDLYEAVIGPLGGEAKKKVFKNNEKIKKRDSLIRAEVFIKFPGGKGSGKIRHLKCDPVTWKLFLNMLL